MGMTITSDDYLNLFHKCMRFKEVLIFYANTDNGEKAREVLRNEFISDLTPIKVYDGKNES